MAFPSHPAKNFRPIPVYSCPPCVLTRPTVSIVFSVRAASSQDLRAVFVLWNNPFEFPGPSGYFSNMRRFFSILIFCGLFAGVFPTEAATGRVLKVLPQFLDTK